jgi:hypothetical protein
MSANHQFLPFSVAEIRAFLKFSGRLCNMRKLNRRDWLALSVPAVASILVGYFYGHEKGWAVGFITGGLMFAFSLWRWRRQIVSYPNDTWKVRL